jgi:hypothetical protein
MAGRVADPTHLSRGPCGRLQASTSTILYSILVGPSILLFLRVSDLIQLYCLPGPLRSTRPNNMLPTPFLVASHYRRSQKPLTTSRLPEKIDRIAAQCSILPRRGSPRNMSQSLEPSAQSLHSPSLALQMIFHKGVGLKMGGARSCL